MKEKNIEFEVKLLILNMKEYIIIFPYLFQMD